MSVMQPMQQLAVCDVMNSGHLHCNAGDHAGGADAAPAADRVGRTSNQGAATVPACTADIVGVSSGATAPAAAAAAAADGIEATSGHAAAATHALKIMALTNACGSLDGVEGSGAGDGSINSAAAVSGGADEWSADDAGDAAAAGAGMSPGSIVQQVSCAEADM